MFKKEKSKTLKSLNFFYILGMVGALISLTTQIVGIAIPENYSSSSSPYYYRTNCSDTLLANCADGASVQSVDFRPIGCIIASMLCASAVIFICNKYVKYFNAEKSSGLKLLTALAAISIVSTTSLLFSGIIYGALSDSAYLGMSLIIMGISCVLSMLAPLLADRMHILDAHHNKWLDYINAILLAGLVGTSTALTNSLVYLPASRCSYYCDQNADTRIIVCQIAAIVILVAAIFVIRRLGRTGSSNEGPSIKQESSVEPLYPPVAPKSVPEITPSDPIADSDKPIDTPEAAPETTPSYPSHMDTLSSPE